MSSKRMFKNLGKHKISGFFCCCFFFYYCKSSIKTGLNRKAKKSQNQAGRGDEAYLIVMESRSPKVRQEVITGKTQAGRENGLSAKADAQ